MFLTEVCCFSTNVSNYCFAFVFQLCICICKLYVDLSAVRKKRDGLAVGWEEPRQPSEGAGHLAQPPPPPPTRKEKE